MLISLVYMTTILSVLLGKSYQLYRGSCRKGALFKVNGRDARLDSSIISSKIFKRLPLCAKACLDEATCKSFNYNKQTKACELLSKTKDEAGQERLISSNGWNHYQPVASETPPRCIPPACDQLCTKKQTCDEDKVDPSGYKCRNLENIALGKKARQSATCYYGWPSRAVDGNRATHWQNDSCTSTCSGGWWRVNFFRTALVHSVALTSRGDCCGPRLSNFNIRVGNERGNGMHNVLCVANKGVPQGATRIFLCRPSLPGQYLHVQTNLKVLLTICEAEVFGEFF